jgi:hypothetical protein
MASYKALFLEHQGSLSSELRFIKWEPKEDFDDSVLSINFLSCASHGVSKLAALAQALTTLDSTLGSASSPDLAE